MLRHTLCTIINIIVKNCYVLYVQLYEILFNIIILLCMNSKVNYLYFVFIVLL